MNLLHQHQLYLCDSFDIYSSYKGWWKCDVCNRKQIRNELFYHCPECNFDSCASCYHQIIAHYRHYNHTFIPSYNSRGKCCDCQQENDIEMFQCNQCVIQFCKSCFQSLQLPSFHHHTLYLSDPSVLYPNQWWKCDCCNEIFGKYQFSSMFHCRECNLDFCFACVEQYII